MISRGLGPFKEDWYSICSKHKPYDPHCNLCNTGQWVNHWKRLMGSVVYKVAPRLWRWWANRNGMNGMKSWINSFTKRK